MSVIPCSQVELMRIRREVNDALQNRDWYRVKDADLSLGLRLHKAATDPQRNPTALLREVQEIVHLYRQLVDACRGEVAALSGS